jgi:hypothetical protein
MTLPFTNPTNRVDPGNNISYDAAGNVTTDNQGQTCTCTCDQERISSRPISTPRPQSTSTTPRGWVAHI